MGCRKICDRLSSPRSPLIRALRAHFPAKWELAVRYGVVIGAPFAAGVSAGASPLGAVAAAASLLILLLGPPGYGIARRAQVLGAAVLLGGAASVGALVQNHAWAIVPGLLVVGAFLAGAALDAHWFDQRQMDTLRHHVLLHADDGAEGTVLAAGESAQAVEMAEQFVGAVDEVDLHPSSLPGVRWSGVRATSSRRWECHGD